MVSKQQLAVIDATLKEARRQCYIAISATKKAQDLTAELYGLMDLEGIKSIIVRKDPTSGRLIELIPEHLRPDTSNNQDL